MKQIMKTEEKYDSIQEIKIQLNRYFKGQGLNKYYYLFFLPPNRTTLV